MKPKLLFVILTLAISIIVANAQRGYDFAEEFLKNPSAIALTQIYSNLKNEYLYDVEDEALTQGAINGMIEALDDPFSYYLDPEKASLRRESQSGEFGGIGATLNTLNLQTDEGVTIVNVYQGGPAWNAGILSGDIFYKVDDTVVETMTVDEVVQLVRGLKGTIVHIEMLRIGYDEPLSFDIERGHIDIISAESSILDNNVGYIHLTTFGNEKLYDQMVEQLDNLKAKGINSLILDLRDNGGGLLVQGILVADEFLDSGDIVFQRSKGVVQRIARADKNYFDLPMVVLVNKNSASASEIVAGALQDNNRAKIVGETTFGKGVAQNVSVLADGGQFAYVVFDWLTPNKRSIHKLGITPDIFAKDTRYPARVSLEGVGEPGQVIEITANGKMLGSTVADDDGKFKFVSQTAPRKYSSVQGEAYVDIENDNALRVALETVLTEIAN